MSNNYIHTFLWKTKWTVLEALRKIKYRKLLEKNHEFYDICNNTKRCFVIGNGPSLREEDLETIQNNNEISFAANRVYKLFENTKWRPTYYAVCDTRLFRNSKDDIDKIECVKFIPLDIYDTYCIKNNYHVFSRVPFTYFNNSPKFSFKLSSRFGEGGTITYHLLQLAASMGFTEIYLLGVDFSFSYGIGPDGKYFEDKSVIHNHHKSDVTPMETMPNLFLNQLAYKQARKKTENKGVKIYNATRGGKLEVFDRVDFDSLFNKDKTLG